MYCKHNKHRSCLVCGLSVLTLSVGSQHILSARKKDKAVSCPVRCVCPVPVTAAPCRMFPGQPVMRQGRWCIRRQASRTRPLPAWWSGEYRADTETGKAHCDNPKPGNLRLPYLAGAEPVKSHLQGQRRHNHRELRHHPFLRRQGENHAQRNVGAFRERNHRFIQHFREPGTGKDLRLELPEIRQGYAILICEELAAQYKNKQNRDTISRRFS